ncbi:MAG: GHMP family kinase ATP-binding protein [Rhodospirillales bacterium]
MKTAEPAPLVLAAAAKLNLYLHVTGVRGDGYHLLDSLIAFASVHDTVHIAPAPEISLHVDGPMAAGVPANSQNLMFKAAEMMRAAFRPTGGPAGGAMSGCALRLTKRLPAAAGIGGGSSDAAAVIRGLARLWGVPPEAGGETAPKAGGETAPKAGGETAPEAGGETAPDDAELFKIAAALGADVPMCLAGRAAFAGGVGESLTPCPDLPEAALVLVNPGAPVATQNVFKARAGPYSPPARFTGAVTDAAALAVHLAERGNDLAAAAERLAPQIIEVREALAAQPGVLLARMSGSGATCFGLFADSAKAAAAARAVAAARPGWWVAPARLVNDAAALAPGLE